MVAQSVGVLTRVQDKIDWRSVAVSAITAGVSKGLDAFSEVGPGFGSGAIRALEANAITQGISVATGLQSKFDWVGLATAGLQGGVSNAVANSSWNPKADSNPFSPASLLNSFVPSLAGGVTAAGVRSLATGTDFGDNLKAVLPDVIASTIGNAIGRGIQQAAVSRAQRAEANDSSKGDFVDLGPLTPVDVVSPLQPVLAAPSGAFEDPGLLKTLGNVVLDGNVSDASSGARAGSRARYSTTTNAAAAVSIRQATGNAAQVKYSVAKTGAVNIAITASGKDGRPSTAIIQSSDGKSGFAIDPTRLTADAGVSLVATYNDPNIGLNKIQIVNKVNGKKDVFEIQQGATVTGDGYKIVFGSDPRAKFNQALQEARSDTAKTVGIGAAGVVVAGASLGLAPLAGAALTDLSIAAAVSNPTLALRATQGVYIVGTGLAGVGATTAEVKAAQATARLAAEQPSLRETVLANLQKSAAARPSANFAKYTQLESGIVAAESGLGRISVPSNLKFGTTLFGNEAHIQAGALLQARLEAQGVTGVINRTGPGMTGVDMSVPRAFEQQLGFRHIEIKPNTAPGLRSFNTQVRNWGYDPATVKAVTYDAQGNLRWGFDF